jgi:hypothetical protein
MIMKKILITLAILAFLNICIVPDSFAAHRHASDSYYGRMYLGIGLLVSAIVSGIYFLTYDAPTSSSQALHAQPLSGDDKTLSYTSKGSQFVITPEYIIISPDEIVIVRW